MISRGDIVLMSFCFIFFFLHRWILQHQNAGVDFVDSLTSSNLVTVLLLLLGPVQLASDLSLLEKMP